MKVQQNVLENLKQQLIEQISNNEVSVLLSSDYQEERIPFMVILGFDSHEVINVGLKDYRLHLKIIVDFFIEDDREGYFFKQTKDQIEEYIEKKYLLTRNNFDKLDQSIVGFFLEDAKNFVTDESNRAELYYQLISSSD